MKGAYCRVCREAGPDLVVQPSDFHVPSNAVPTLALEFNCGMCRRRWAWVAELRGKSVTYKFHGRVEPALP